MAAVTTYKWVRSPDGHRFEDVGLRADGTLHNPNGYPADDVRRAIAAADERRGLKRSGAAKKAAATRRLRQERKVYDAAHRFVAGHHLGPCDICRICGRSLADEDSIKRGIGSDCWQDVLTLISRLRIT
jgi:hypothetical protein